MRPGLPSAWATGSPSPQHHSQLCITVPSFQGLTYPVPRALAACEQAQLPRLGDEQQGGYFAAFPPSGALS